MTDPAALSRRALLAGLTLGLAGCGAPQTLATREDMSRARYVHGGQPALTLFTMKNVGTDNGAHTGLMINASQRVIFDPAGSLTHPLIVDNNDVIFGITPTMLDIYRSAHARSTYYVIEQYAPVSAEAAELALQKALVAGPVGKARCTYATSEIIASLPGVNGIRPTFFPDNLYEQFKRMPGLQTFEHREFDRDNTAEALQVFEAQLAAEAAAR